MKGLPYYHVWNVTVECQVGFHHYMFFKIEDNRTARCTSLVPRPSPCEREKKTAGRGLVDFITCATAGGRRQQASRTFGRTLRNSVVYGE